MRLNNVNTIPITCYSSYENQVLKEIYGTYKLYSNIVNDSLYLNIVYTIRFTGVVSVIRCSPILLCALKWALCLELIKQMLFLGWESPNDLNEHQKIAILPMNWLTLYESISYNNLVWGITPHWLSWPMRLLPRRGTRSSHGEAPLGHNFLTPRLLCCCCFCFLLCAWAPCLRE